MIALFFMVQLLNLVQLSAADVPHTKKKRHYHKQMTFYDNQRPSLRASQKSNISIKSPYEYELLHFPTKTLEINCTNFKTVTQRSARTSGIKPQKYAIVHVVRTKRKR
jgi:hypothetical protein